MKRVCTGLVLLAVVFLETWVLPKYFSVRKDVTYLQSTVSSSLQLSERNAVFPSFCYCDSRIKRVYECEFILNRSVLIHQPVFDSSLPSASCLLLDHWLLSRKETINHPVYSIVLTVWNQERNINNTLMSLLKYTRGPWELIIVFDQCRDRSISIVQEIRFMNSNPTLIHVRLIKQDTGVGETSANNIGMRASHHNTIYFILIQDDHIMTMSGWNILLAEPARAFSDVFSVSARCGHTAWSSVNKSFIGRCNKDISKPLSMSFLERCKFYVRDSANRGPLLLHASRTRQLGFLDEENYWLGDDEHDLNFRAYAAHGWIAGFRPIDFESPLEIGGSRRTINVPQMRDEIAYRENRIQKRAKRLGALEQFLSRKWLTTDTFIKLDLTSGIVNLRTFLQKHDRFRKLTQSHDETRSLNQCGRSIHNLY